MRARTAWLLVVLAGLGLGAAWLFAWNAGRGRTELAEAPAMFPALASRLAAAARVEIVHQGRTVALARDGNVWRLPDHAGYPARAEALHGLLAGLVALSLLEPRTADPASYARLGLDDPAAATSSGTLVRVLAGDGATLCELVLGGSRIGGQGEATRRDVYVRRPGEAGTWLAEPLVVASPDWRDWADRTIVDIRPDDVSGIVSTRVGGPRLALSRDGEHLRLTAPAEHAALDRFKLDDMARALADLTFRDVRATADAPGAAVGEATIVTREGLAIIATVRRDGEDVWVLLAASGEGAAALRPSLDGWAFQVDAWKEAALVPTLGDLAAYAPPPPATTTSPPPPKPGRR